MTTQPATMVSFFAPGKPQPGGSKKGFVNPRNGRVVIVEDAKRNKDWRAVVALAAQEAMGGHEPLTGPLALAITFYIPRPKGHYGSGKNAGRLKANAPRYSTSKPDSTKLLRSTEDAMSGIVWRDDAQVVIQTVSRLYADGQPGALIVVTGVEE